MDKDFNFDFEKLEGSLLNAEKQTGINPLELWMADVIVKKNKDKKETKEES